MLGARLAVLSALVAGAHGAAVTYPCTADDYAADQFTQWDVSGDGLISASEVEASIAAVLGLPDLSSFPALRASVRRQYRTLDVMAPFGLDRSEFAAAAWVRCGHSCQCTAEPNPNVTSTRRRLQGEGVSLPGSTNVPGLWHEIESLKGDLAGTVKQMSLFNSNQMRATVKASVEKLLADLVTDLTGLSNEVLESVICGGLGECSAIQLQIINGVGGLFDAFIDLPSAFLTRIVMYVVPSFTLLQTFQASGSLGMEVPSISIGPVEGVPTGAEGGSDANLDVIILLHVVPGADTTINGFLARTAKLPLFPAVALAHLTQDGGFSLDFSVASVISSPGSVLPGKPVLDVALESELTAIATAYEELVEFDDTNANGVFDEGEPTGVSFKLGELAWKPIQHTTSDGSCMTETDLSLLDLGTLQALCIGRGLPLCTGPGVEHAELVAYLESNPIGCPVSVETNVLLVVESRTAFIPKYPTFSFAVSFVTSTRPLQNELGTIVAPNRVKVSVEILNFPFSIGLSRPRLALKVAHTGAAPRVDMNVIGNIGLDAPFDFGSIDLSLLDSLGNFPNLPAFPDLPSIPGLPWGGDDSSEDGGNGTGAEVPTEDEVPSNESDWTDWLPWRPWSATADSASQKLSSQQAVSVATTTDTTSAVLSRLVMSQSNSLEVNRDGTPSATAVYSVAVAAATATNPSLTAHARDAFGGDVVAAMLANGSLSAIPSKQFAAAAYSTWDEHVFVDKNGTRAIVRASALGTANLDIGSIGGLAAYFFAGVNATASKQYVSFDTNSPYILWDPAVGLGERPEWRKARAEVAAQSTTSSPDEQGVAQPDTAPSQDSSGSVPAEEPDKSDVGPEGPRTAAAVPSHGARGFDKWIASNAWLLFVIAIILVAFGFILLKARQMSLVAKQTGPSTPREHDVEGHHAVAPRRHGIPTLGSAVLKQPKRAAAVEPPADVDVALRM